MCGATMRVGTVTPLKSTPRAWLDDILLQVLILVKPTS
jgi:hypothetical protein